MRSKSNKFNSLKFEENAESEDDFFSEVADIIKKEIDKVPEEILKQIRENVRIKIRDSELSCLDDDAFKDVAGGQSNKKWSDNEKE